MEDQAAIEPHVRGEEATLPQATTVTSGKEPSFPQYPVVPFNIDEDIGRSVLDSCVSQIEGNYYAARAQGADLVIDRDTAYFNASDLVGDDKRLNELLSSDTMKLQFDYIKYGLGREPFYRVTGKTNRRLNGTYMHGVTIGNVLSVVTLKKL